MGGLQVTVRNRSGFTKSLSAPYSEAKHRGRNYETFDQGGWECLLVLPRAILKSNLEVGLGSGTNPCVMDNGFPADILRVILEKMSEPQA